MHDVKVPDGMNTIDDPFSRLVELYQTPLRRMCCIWLRDASLAEDAVQEAFLRAYRALPSFRNECSEKTWLFRIAVNVCRNLKRSRWFRFVDRSVEIERLPEASVPFTPEDDALLQAVTLLPLRQREAILLYYYQNMTMTEIAHALNTTPSTVSRRLCCAEIPAKTAERREHL